MATQGLVTIVSGGKVVLKAVAGSNGFNAPFLADKIREAIAIKPLSPMEVHTLAVALDFGDSLSLVISYLHEGEIKHVCGDQVDVEEIGGLYLTKFSEPEFNPRWENGSADYVEVVEV